MPYETYLDFATGNAGLDAGYADAVVSPGTRVVLDTLDPNCYPGQTLPTGAIAAGATLTNLVNMTAELTVDTVAFPALAAGGLVFNASGQRVLLPASVKNAAGVTDFFVGAWIKPAAQAIAAGQYASPFSHIAGGTDVLTDWVAQCAYATPTLYSLRACGASASISDVLQDVVTFIGLRCQVNVSAGTHVVTSYKNGVAQNNSAAIALPAGGFPVVTDPAMIGHSSRFAGPGWRGQVGRFVFQDFSVAGSKTFAQFMAAEMLQGSGPRFS